MLFILLLAAAIAVPCLAQKPVSTPEDIEWTWEVRPPHPNPQLPNVLLLGDSISRNYFPQATYYQRAIELDPNFAIGYRAVGADYASLGELGRASEYYTKAFQLREHASEREKLTITASYYQSVTGELDKAAQTFQEEIESYPREAGGYSTLGLVYTEQGQYEKATEITKQCVRLAPDHVEWYSNLANYTLALQRFEETRQIIHEAQARKLDNPMFHNAFYALASLREDSAAMAEQQQWFAGKPDYENWGLALASDTEAYGGHVGKARELTKRAVDSLPSGRTARKMEQYGKRMLLCNKQVTAIPRKRGSQRQRL
jgi:tetratricopeptide (TPR) repeat protein